MNWLIYVLGGWFWFLLIVQIVIIIITIVIATSKGYSGILAFLLGLFIPLLGSLIIVALLPDKNIMYSNGGNSSTENRKVNLPQKKCKSCNRTIDGDYTACPHCGNNTFESLENVFDINAPVNMNYGDSWVCKKCSTRNSNNSPTCKDCGAYK